VTFPLWDVAKPRPLSLLNTAAYSSTLNMEAASFSKISQNFYRIQGVTSNKTCHNKICSIGSPTRCTWIYMYSLFLYIFALHVAGAICIHPQEHKLQSAVIGVCNGYGMLIYWSRYWLGHPHTCFAVKFGRVRVSQPVPAPID
jgi:hypothetical protein